MGSVLRRRYGTGRAGRCGRVAQRARLNVEALEDRRLLVVGTCFLITTTIDSVDINVGDGVAVDANGETSLRAAIMELNASSDGGLITLPGGEFVLDLIDINNESDATNDLDVSKHITISGAGPGLSTIRANFGEQTPETRVFSVTDQLTLSGVNVTGGHVTGRGGGILVTSGGVLDLTTSAITANSATTDGGGISFIVGSGGATDLEARLKIMSSTISGNSASGQGGGVQLYSYGNQAALSTLIRDTDFLSNQASGGGGLSVETLGGPDIKGSVLIDGGFFQDNQADVGGGLLIKTAIARITGSEFANNLAANPQPSAGSAIQIVDGALYMADSLLQENGYGPSSTAAALATVEASSLQLTRSTITANFGPGIAVSGSYDPDANAVTMITESTVSGNEGTGIRVTGKVDFMLMESTISDNRSQSYGGGLYLAGDVYSPYARIENSTISENSTYGTGGGVFVYSTIPESVEFIQTTITDNRAEMGAGGIASSRDPVRVENSILANSTNQNGMSLADVDGPFISVGVNLVEDPGMSLGFGGADILGDDPQLGPLTGNGGLTLTHLPSETSPVIDAVPGANRLTDQRRLPGSSDGGDTTDIGAVELGQVMRGVISGSITVENVGGYSYPGDDLPVQLYADTDGDGDFSPADDLIETTTTDIDGDYLFASLATGLYFVVATDPFAGTDVPMSATIADDGMMVDGSTVDSFVTPLFRPDPGTFETTGFDLAIEAIGLARDFIYVETPLDIAAGQLNLDSGTVTIEWDGGDTFERSTDVSLDLSNVSDPALHFTYSAPDDVVQGWLELTSSNGNVSVLPFELAVGSHREQVVPLSELRPATAIPEGVDLADISSIVLRVNSGSGTANFGPIDFFSISTGTADFLFIQANTPPVAVDEYYTTIVDTPLSTMLGVNDLLQNDFDLDGDTLTVNPMPISGPSSGLLDLNSDGTFTYTPDPGFSDSDLFVYEITDGIDTDTATVRIVVVGASLVGTVFNDINGDGSQGAGEQGVPGIEVFLDNNRNGVRDSVELSRTTDATGTYIFDGLAAGSYEVVQVLPDGAAQTAPQGRFAAPRTITTLPVIRSITGGDVDNDGDRDVIIASDIAGALQVLLNDGSGSFTPQTPFALGTRPQTVRANDFDDDGNVDLAITLAGVPNDPSTSQLVVMLGNGNGTFTEQTRIAAGAGLLDLQAADLDGDGDHDLAATSFRSGELLLFRNDGGVMSLLTSVIVGDQPIAATVGDIDNDGDADILVANFLGDNVVSVLNQNGSFVLGTTVASGLGPGYLDLADVNGDRNLDLATAFYGRTDENGDFSVNDSLTVSLGDGRGGFTESQSHALPSGARAEYVRFTNYDLDADVDLLVVESERSVISVFENDGSGSFSLDVELASTLATTGGGPEWITVGNFNADGMPDVVAANLNGDITGLLRMPVPIRATVAAGQTVTGLNFGTIGAPILITTPVSSSYTAGHNPDLIYDTNGDSIVSPIDALLVLNALSAKTLDDMLGMESVYADVNNDGFVTAHDALLVINQLSQQPALNAPLKSGAQPRSALSDRAIVRGDGRDQASDPTGSSIAPGPVTRPGQAVASLERRLGRAVLPETVFRRHRGASFEAAVDDLFASDVDSTLDDLLLERLLLIEDPDRV